jgi:prepilin-type N-terminal cleavage/methylation domain-containing protein
VIASSLRISPRRAPRHRRGFSLAEMLLAIFILGIGVISVAAIFPAGISLQRQSNDDTIGPMVADSAMALLRSRLTQEDFGSFTDFNANQPPYAIGPDGGLPILTVEGDWPWMRPGFVFDDPGTAVDEGTLDIFSQQLTRERLGVNPESQFGMTGLAKATELNAGWPVAGTKVLWGIPYNPFRYAVLPSTAGADWLRARPEPRVFVRQRERYWPMSADPAARPQYVWECMFRRFQGKVYVAVFVYRVTFPGGAPQLYRVAPASAAGSSAQAPQSPDRSPLPSILFTPSVVTSAWVAPTTGDPTVVPGTASGPVRFNQRSDPRTGRSPDSGSSTRTTTFTASNTVGVPSALTVLCASPVPIPVDAGGSGLRSSRRDRRTGFLDSEGVATAWYMPLTDANGVQLTPVFVSVEEL